MARCSCSPGAVRVRRAPRSAVGTGRCRPDLATRARRRGRPRAGGPGGFLAGVGVVGYSTGGGVGPLARTLGIASDRVGHSTWSRATASCAERPSTSSRRLCELLQSAAQLCATGGVALAGRRPWRSRRAAWCSRAAVRLARAACVAGGSVVPPGGGVVLASGGAVHCARTACNRRRRAGAHAAASRSDSSAGRSRPPVDSERVPQPRRRARCSSSGSRTAAARRCGARRAMTAALEPWPRRACPTSRRAAARSGSDG